MQMDSDAIEGIEEFRKLVSVLSSSRDFRQHAHWLQPFFTRWRLGGSVIPLGEL